MTKKIRLKSIKASKPSLTIVGDGTDIFLVSDGRQIAKRGQPETRYAKQWIPLEPGVVVRDAPHPDPDYLASLFRPSLP